LDLKEQAELSQKPAKIAIFLKKSREIMQFFDYYPTKLAVSTDF
jgi:hypothetical protein